MTNFFVIDGGHLTIGTVPADGDNGWDSAVVLESSLNRRSYVTPAEARAIAADLLAAADKIEAETEYLAQAQQESKYEAPSPGYAEQ